MCSDHISPPAVQTRRDSVSGTHVRIRLRLLFGCRSSLSRFVWLALKIRPARRYLRSVGGLWEIPMNWKHSLVVRLSVQCGLNLAVAGISLVSLLARSVPQRHDDYKEP